MLDGVRFDGGLSVRTYARGDAPGTLRRKDEKRKTDRAARRERKAAEKEAKKTELRRLRNLKRAELASKLAEIEAIAGFKPAAGGGGGAYGEEEEHGDEEGGDWYENEGGHEENGHSGGGGGARSRKNRRTKLKKQQQTEREERRQQQEQTKSRGDDHGAGGWLARIFAEMGEDLDGDFDPASFDRAMQTAFGDEYYDAGEHAPEEVRGGAGLAEEDDDEKDEGDTDEKKSSSSSSSSSSSAALNSAAAAALERVSREVTEAKRLAGDMAKLRNYDDVLLGGTQEGSEDTDEEQEPEVAAESEAGKRHVM